MIKRIFIVILLVSLAGLSALNYNLFVFPNSFAPAGVDGICTMIQYLTNTSMGYLSLVVNIPLLVGGYFVVDKVFIRRTAIYTVAFSVFTVLLRDVDLSALEYYTETGTSVVLAPIAAGVIRGLLYAVTIGIGASGGGMDVVAAIIKRYRPHHNLMSIILALNTFVACCAYFIYGFKPEPVICSIIYSFVTSTVYKSVEAARRENVRFEIITDASDTLCSEICNDLKLSSTVIDAKGGYSGTDKKVIICVADKGSVPKLEKLLRKYRGTVSFENMITSTERIRKY